MSVELIEAIEKHGLIKGNKVNARKIRNLNSSEILDFVSATRELTSSKHMSREKSAYAFSSSLSLSGGTFPCSEVVCRLKKAESLAQFSALYSDRVYIDYFPSDYLNHVERIEKLEYGELQNWLVKDLTVLSYYRPLIEAEKIIPITHPNYCSHCLTKSFGDNADKRFKDIFPALAKRYSKETIVTVEKNEGKFVFNVKAPEMLLEHGGAKLITLEIPYSEKIPHVLDQLQAGKKVSLTPNDIKKIKLDKELASYVHTNLVFELASTQSINTNFLTERDLDIQAIRNILGDPATEKRNQLVQKYLTCLVPFAEDVHPEDLLKIRNGENDAFIVFRQGLNQVIDEYRKQKTGFTENDAREIYGDIIEPKLAQLNSRVSTARKSFIKNTASKIAGWAGAISFGWYSGLLPSDLATVASTLGLIKIIAEITEGTLSKSNMDSTIRDDPMYFLWKVKKTIKKNP
jgi:hypothetical protein